MARFYAHQKVPGPVVAELRRIGHEVLTMLQSGHAGQALPDVDVLAFATADGPNAARNRHLAATR